MDTTQRTALSDAPEAPERLVFSMRTRLDLEHGSAFGTSPDSPSNFVPGFEHGPIDVVALNATVTGLLKDHLDVALGRHLLSDAAGFASFDGLRARWRLTDAVYIEGRAGFETRYGMPLVAGGAFESDGVLRAPRANWSANAAPDVISLAAMPYVAGEAYADLGWVRMAGAYRRTSDPSTGGLSREEVALNASTAAGRRWSLSANARYAMHAARLASLRADTQHLLGRGWSANAYYTFFQPTFDAASIWNVFFVSPTSALGMEVRTQLRPGCAVSAGAELSLLGASQAGVGTRVGGQASATCNVGRDAVELRARAKASAAGNGQAISHTLVYAGYEHPLDMRWSLRTRAQAWRLEGNERAELDGVGAGGVAGAYYTLSSGSVAGVDVERNWGSGPNASARVMAYLDVAVWP